MSERSRKSRWMNRSTSRNCSLIAARTLLKRTMRENAVMIFKPRSTLPQWLLASSRTNRSSKMSRFTTSSLGAEQYERRRVRQTVYFYSFRIGRRRAQRSCAGGHSDERHAPRRRHGGVVVRVPDDDRRGRVKTRARQAALRQLRLGQRSPRFRLPHHALEVRSQVEVLQKSRGGAAPLVGDHKGTHTGGAQITQALLGSRVHVGHLPAGGIVVPAEGRRQLPPKSRRRRRVGAADHVIERQAEVRPLGSGVVPRDFRERRPKGRPNARPSVDKRSVEIEERCPPAR